MLLLLLACEEMPAPGEEPDPPAPPARNDLNPPVWILGSWRSCTPVPGGVEVDEDSTWWLFTADSVQSATYRFGLEDYEIDYTAPAYTVTDARSPSRYEITGAVPDRHGNIVMVRHTFLQHQHVPGLGLQRNQRVRRRPAPVSPVARSVGRTAPCLDPAQ